jgi:antibiotic biosynthesis monooxygenase (ABM) superfamily enzyme
MDTQSIINSMVIGLSTTWWVPYALSQQDARIKWGILLAIFTGMFTVNLGLTANFEPAGVFLTLLLITFIAAMPIVCGLAYYRYARWQK